MSAALDLFNAYTCLYEIKRTKGEKEGKKERERKTRVHIDINLRSDKLRVRNKYEITYTCPKANYKH